MTHRRNPNTQHGVIEEGARELGGWDAAGDIIEKPGKWLRDAANPSLEGRHANTVTYNQARNLTRAGALAFAQDLAGLAGMALVPLENGLADPAEIMNRSAELMREAGEAMAVVGASVADGKITASERSDMERQVLDVERAARELRRTLAGNGR